MKMNTNMKRLSENVHPEIELMRILVRSRVVVEFKSHWLFMTILLNIMSLSERPDDNRPFFDLTSEELVSAKYNMGFRILHSPQFGLKGGFCYFEKAIVG